MNPDNVDEWVLVLEYLPRPADEAKGYGHLHAIMEELRTWHPAALFSPDRYALQLRVLADRPMEALRRGLNLHDRAVGTVGMPVPSLARIEVMTEGEFESQWNETGRGFATATPAGTVLTNEIYWSTRALLRAATPADLAEVLASFVIAVGGRIQHGSPQIPAGDIAIDISLEDGEGCHAIVDRVSVPGLIIEHSLPTLVADARAARARLRQRDSLPASPGRARPRPWRSGEPGVSLERMFETNCLDCRADVTFTERPGDSVCGGCGLRMYVTADGRLGRYLPEGWRPGGIQGTA